VKILIGEKSIEVNNFVIDEHETNESSSGSRELYIYIYPLYVKNHISNCQHCDLFHKEQPKFFSTKKSCQSAILKDHYLNTLGYVRQKQTNYTLTILPTVTRQSNDI
jgi:hypothetical protein